MDVSFQLIWVNTKEQFCKKLTKCLPFLQSSALPTELSKELLIKCLPK